MASASACGSLNLHSSVIQASNQVAADLDGEVAVMNIQSGKYHCLNATSARIWKLLETKIQVGDLCQKLTEEFEVPREQCEVDVLAHLQDLLAQQLIEIDNATAA